MLRRTTDRSEISEDHGSSWMRLAYGAPYTQTWALAQLETKRVHRLLGRLCGDSNLLIGMVAQGRNRATDTRIFRRPGTQAEATQDNLGT